MSSHDGTKVFWSKKVQKQLKRLPQAILGKFQFWVLAVELEGIKSVRMRPGYHDEPLSGDRKGQRSVRLNIAYRVIYIEKRYGTIEFLEVLEVNKHEY